MNLLKTFLVPFCLGFVCALFTSKAYAGEADPGTAGSSFAAVYWENGSDGTVDGGNETGVPELYIRQQDGFEQLRPQFNQMGALMLYHGPRLMPVYRRSVNEEGQVEYLPVAQVSLPETSSFLLFISRKRGFADSYGIVAMDVSARAIPPGSVAFLNFTDKQVAADIRGDRRSVPPMSHLLFVPKDSNEPELPLKIAVFDEAWKQAYATVTRISNKQSYLMIFYLSNGREGAFRLRILRNLALLRNGAEAEQGALVARE